MMLFATFVGPGSSRTCFVYFGLREQPLEVGIQSGLVYTSVGRLRQADAAKGTGGALCPIEDDRNEMAASRNIRQPM